MQVIPAYRLQRLQARLVVVESIHQRIKRLREAKKLSQEALADLAGVKYQSVQEWERKDGTAPTRKRQAKVAAALGVTVHELMTGSEPAQFAILSPKEELLLEMFRIFTPEQQREQLNYVRALYDANRITQPFTGKPLRTISNEEVEAVVGKVPSPALARRKSKSRRSGFSDDDPE